MNMTIGYTLGLKDLFKTFRMSRLHITTEQCMKEVGSLHKEKVVYKIFRYTLSLIIQDIINNNITFELPTGKKKACLHMVRFSGNEFNKARQNGKWSGVHPLFSRGSANQIAFDYLTGGIHKRKLVYLDPDNRDKITELTNNGKQYY